MKRWLLAVGIGTSIICTEIGCIGAPFESANRLEPQQESAIVLNERPRADLPLRNADGKDAAADHDGGSGAQARKNLQPSDKVRRPQPVAQDASDESDEPDESPNAILIVTCESEPDEIAVPLNALDNRYCDKIQAKAYRADEEGAYEVTATYDWSIADQQVACIVPLPGHEHKSVQRPSVLNDMFTAADHSHEPETTVTVCAQPPGGWKETDHAPLCRTLPLRAVVNLDAAWCFSGPTFQPDPGVDCQALLIEQDGRYLYVGPDGNGSVFGADVHFYMGDYYYHATLSDREHMSGTVQETETDEKAELGTWQAWRLPL